MTRGRHSSVAEASRTAHANAGAEAAQQEEVFDIHVDTQYAATNCNERTDDAALAFRDRFAREPWECCRDAPNTYLSLRVGKRAQFLEKLGEKDRAKRARVQHEIDRITQTRVNFSSYANKTKLMEDLRNSREAWKDEVVRKRSEYEKKTRKKAAQQPQNERWQRDLKLLDRLRAWPESEAESDPPPPPVNIEELYGFRAGAVYFKKHTDSGGANAAWKGFKYPHEKYKGDFPNQKIPVHDLLDKVEDNPLREPCDPDVIRWFHFPTNNMHWVEVRRPHAIPDWLYQMLTFACSPRRKRWRVTIEKSRRSLTTTSLAIRCQRQRRFCPGNSGEARCMAQGAEATPVLPRSQNLARKKEK